MRKPAFFSATRISGSSSIERAGDAHAQRAGLTRHAATVDRRVDVVDLGRVGELERLEQQHLVGLAREVRRVVARVDGHLAGAGADAHTGDRLLAAAG